MSGCAVDHGREATYAAEERSFGGTDLAQVVPFAVVSRRGGDTVTGPWWAAAGGPAVAIAPARAGTRSSSARHEEPQAVVRIAAGQCDLATLAHELAHVLAGVVHAHDARFRAADVDLVALLGGAGAAEQLGSAYREFGLAVAPRSWPPPFKARGDSFVVIT